MKQNKKIAYTLVLLLAGVALAVDRMIQPESAPADEPVARVADEPTSVAGAAPSGPEVNVRALLAAELRAYAESRPILWDKVDDAFALHETLRPKPEPTPDLEATGTGLSVPAHNLELSGTVVTGKARYAIINGRVVFVGRSIAGWRLASVEAQRAILEQDGRRVVLELPEPTINRVIGQSGS